MADLLRTRIAPLLIPRAAAFSAVRDYLFRTVSQVMLNYRGGPLSRGAAADSCHPHRRRAAPAASTHC